MQVTIEHGQATIHLNEHELALVIDALGREAQQPRIKVAPADAELAHQLEGQLFQAYCDDAAAYEDYLATNDRSDAREL